MLLPFRCLTKKKSEGKELAISKYVKSMPSLKEADEPQRCSCLQWATAGSAEKGHEAGKEAENGVASAIVE